MALWRKKIIKVEIYMVYSIFETLISVNHKDMENVVSVPCGPAVSVTVLSTAISPRTEHALSPAAAFVILSTGSVFLSFFTKKVYALLLSRGHFLLNYFLITSPLMSGKLRAYRGPASSDCRAAGTSASASSGLGSGGVGGVLTKPGLLVPLNFYGQAEICEFHSRSLGFAS